MFRRKSFSSLFTRVSLTAITLASLAFLIACGSSSNSADPPPSGGFNNSNLNGTYVFAVTGTDFTNFSQTGSSSFFGIGGTLSANGSGGLTGTIDVNDPALESYVGSSGPVTGLAANGTYNITSDGRGTGSVSTTINNHSYTFGLDFVLTSSSHAVITRFDGNGTGSGTMDAASSEVSQSAIAGSYAFVLSGVDSVGNPLGTIGTLTLGANGAVTSGVQDFNDNGDSNFLAAVPLQTSSMVNIGSTPGRAQLTTTTSFGTLNFDVWVIGPSHLKLIETDTAGPVLSGDAYVSTGQSFPSGTLVYTMNGMDTVRLPLALGGYFNSSNPSASGLEDVNDFGWIAQSPSVASIVLSPKANRSIVTFSGMYNGGWNQSSPGTTGTYTFAAYPFSYGSRGVGVVLLEVDSLGGITSGTAYLQTSTSLASSQGYGLNLSGDNRWGEADMIAEFTATSDDMTGLYDVNNSGALVSDQQFGTSNSSTSDTYSVGTSGRGTAQIPLQTTNNSILGTLDLTFYTIDGSNFIFIETDSNQVSTGVFEQQNSSSSTLAAPLPQFNMANGANSSSSLQKKQE